VPNAKQIAVISAGVLLIAIMILSVVIPLITGIGTNPVVNVEGIYVYNNGNWKKIDTNGTLWLPKDKGTYLIYFRNLNCPACQQFDAAWSDYFKNYMPKSSFNITPVEIVCTYFSSNCQDPSARATFNAFEQSLGQYFGTPYIVLISNGTFIYFNFPPVESNGTFSSQSLNQTITEVLYNYYHPPTQTNTTTTS
jgi:hypothetical protein